MKNYLSTKKVLASLISAVCMASLLLLGIYEIIPMGISILIMSAIAFNVIVYKTEMKDPLNKFFIFLFGLSFVLSQIIIFFRCDY